MIDRVHKVVVEKRKAVSCAELLRIAEDRDLVELILIDEQRGDLYYRFTENFLRIAFYQMISFRGTK
jgi:hypothetical protein